MFPRTITRCGSPLAKSLHVVSRRQKHGLQRVSCMFPQPGSSTQRRHEEAGGGGCISQQLMLHNRLMVGGAAGTFSLLPQLTRALEKLYRLIDEEMKNIGAQKIAMPCLAPARMWRESSRWEEMDAELFKLQDKNEGDHCLNPTHEEMVTSLIATDCPISHRRLPIKLYQIGRKFRDEKRPKNGLLRGREFEMKDLYCFDVDELAASSTYDAVCSAYDRLFQRLDLPVVKVEASTGSMGGDRSQEFHLVADIGEDSLYKCKQCGKGVNKELIDEGGNEKCERADCGPDFHQVSGIEIAHAFILGTKYTEVFGATYMDEDQRKRLQYMSCYGIGVTRLLAAALEVLSTNTKLRWPNLLAPHQICVVPQKKGFKSEVTTALAERLCERLGQLTNLHREVVLDDRMRMSIGKRIGQASEMGFPHTVALGKKALEDTPLYEYIDVYNDKTEFCTEDELVEKFSTLNTVVL